MCAGAENGEKCGDGAGVAERAQTGEGSWNTCIAKVWWHLFVKWPEKRQRLWFQFFFFFLSSGFRARGVKLELLWKTRSRFFLSEDNGFVVLKMISFRL